MPELAEPIEYINEQLIADFGRDTITGRPIWRVVWTDDQLEFLYGLFPGQLYKERRLVKKYNSDNYTGKYILEQLLLVPEIDLEMKCDEKTSYEPIWTFEDKRGNYLPPCLDVCKIVIDAIHKAKGKSRVKEVFKDIRNDGANGLIAKKERVEQIKREMFGNETDIVDNVSAGQGIFLSGNNRR